MGFRQGTKPNEYEVLIVHLFLCLPIRFWNKICSRDANLHVGSQDSPPCPVVFLFFWFTRVQYLLNHALTWCWRIRVQWVGVVGWMPKLIELTRQFSSPKANDMCYDLFQEWHHSFPLRISNPFSKLITVSWIRFDHLLNILPKSIIEDIFIHEHTDLDSRRSSFWTRDSFCLRTLSSRIYFEKNKHGKSMQELINKGFNFNFNGQILIQKPLKSGRKKMIDFHVFNLLVRVG
jgi:hypothetical protein